MFQFGANCVSLGYMICVREVVIVPLQHWEVFL